MSRLQSGSSSWAHELSAPAAYQRRPLHTVRLVSRPVGIEAFYWLDRWSDDQSAVFGRAAQAGYDGVEISLVPGFSEIDLRGISRAAAEAGIRVLCSTGLNPAIDISSPDASVRASGLRHLRRCLSQSAELGSPILGGVTYAPWMFLADADADADERRKRSADSLSEVAAEAVSMRIDICLEVLNRFETFMFNTVADCVAFIRSIGEPGFKVQVDTFHMNIEEDDLAEAVRLASGELGHVQVAANNRRGPQFGHIDWEAFQAALDAIGYKGWVVFETFPNPAVETGRDTRAWRRLAGDLNLEAADAASFIRQRIA
jgi:D-psicose/D-tagatose/L-ribulose 3-epimerase